MNCVWFQLVIKLGRFVVLLKFDEIKTQVWKVKGTMITNLQIKVEYY